MSDNYSVSKRMNANWTWL